MPIQQRWKGKEREIYGRDEEGTGGQDGIVLSLALVGTGVYDAAYTIPVKVGNQQFSLQVDIGSSDLWIASTSCSSSSCSRTKGHLYDPGGATQTGVQFSIPYLSGSAAGPIVWDNVTIGGYTIDNQALAAANDVESEDLASNFDGILGLALPLNSVIASDIPPVTDNNPDGAAWASNLFSISPTSASPSARFLSLALSRPGSDTIPAVFGIGRHPSSLVPDPSVIQYSALISDRPGTLFWKVAVSDITVYVNGTRRRVQLKGSNNSPAPIAVLDSGVSLILTTSNIANGIYGAIGISPASDGMYYVPCTTPLNMSITLDNRPEIPLHPLDITAEPPDDNRAQFCVGLIQTADSQLSNPNSSLGDIILGVPFLRNVYTVMAYTAPNPNGSFTPLNGSNQTISPRLGLLSLTDPAIALEEFNTVRVLNQPISGGGSSSPSGNVNNPTVNLGGKKLTVGIVVLIGLLSFFTLCCVLFLARWLMFRRKYRMAAAAGTLHQMDGVDMFSKATCSSKDEKSSFGEDGYVGYKVEEAAGMTDSTLGNDRTKLEVVNNWVEEFGVRTEQVGLGPGREDTSGDDTLILNNLCALDHLPFPSPNRTQRPPTSSHHQISVTDHHDIDTGNHHETNHGELLGDDFEITPVDNNVRISMAGVGTAFRTSKIDSDSIFRRDSNVVVNEKMLSSDAAVPFSTSTS